MGMELEWRLQIMTEVAMQLWRMAVWSMWEELLEGANGKKGIDQERCKGG